MSVEFSINGSSTASNGAGVDYELVGGTVTFPAESTADEVIAVTIHNDVIYEMGETIMLDLNNPSNMAIGTNGNHNVTISDDETEPTVQFKLASSSVGEGETIHNILVEFSGESKFPVAMDYTISGSITATNGAGQDYELSAGTVNFAANVTVDQTIPVTIHDDAIWEDSETVILDLGNPSNTTVGTNGTHTATIIDDETEPTLQFKTASRNSVEDEGTVSWY